MREVHYGLSFTEALTVVFIVLKLIHVISWSWWWVLSPLWIPAALLIVFGVITFSLLIFKHGTDI